MILVVFYVCEDTRIESLKFFLRNKFNYLRAHLAKAQSASSCFFHLEFPSGCTISEQLI